MERNIMHKLIISALIVLLAAPAFAADAPKTVDQKTLYAVGLVMARQIAVFNFTPAEFEIVKQGLSDAMSGKTSVGEADAYGKQIQELAVARRKVEGERLAGEAKAFMAKAAKEKDAVTTKSGLIYIPLNVGSGPNPTINDTVKVNYRGTLVDGKEFDSSFKRNQPAEFPLRNVIKCWGEGVQLMKVGGKAKLVCPSELAYGEKGAGSSIPPNATLIFEVELLEVKTGQAPAIPGHTPEKK
jgi:FKBP-type peptidyl-prolyl cis-trans isomerase FkpA